MRFLPHFWLDRQLEDRVIPIDDGGTKIILGGDCELLILPVHFMHSLGNFQVYDPCSNIPFSEDLGASLGQDYFFMVERFINLIENLQVGVGLLTQEKYRIPV